MIRLVTLCLTGLLAGTSIAAFADDARVRQLELDVAQLRREVLAQARRIDELERQSLRGVYRPPQVTAPEAQVSPPELPAWLDAANWDRLRAGMSETEVVQLLGAPTSIRPDTAAERKTLFYALELGPKAFLAGSVELTNGRVAGINKPVLR